MGLQHWAIAQGRRHWQRQAGAIAMLRGVAQRARTGDGAGRSRRLIERGAPLHHG